MFLICSAVESCVLFLNFCKNLLILLCFRIDILATSPENLSGGRTGLVVRASDSGSGDPGSILGRVGVLFP